MSGSMSDTTETKVLGHLVGKTAFTMPATPYLALLTTAATDADTGSTIVEATYTGYSRLSVPGTSWGTPTSGNPSSIANSSALTFPACTAGTSTIVGWALVDASTAGNILVYGTLTASVTVSTTQTPVSFAAGALTVTAD